MVSHAPALPPLIELREIKRHYGGQDGSPKQTVLHGLTLQIHKGEFVAIVGPSGSGKSTLMNILGCLDRADSGSYFFNGQDVSQYEPDKLAWLRREAFGFVFQGYHLISSESALENVQLPALYANKTEPERVARASELLQRLGLGAYLHKRPQQLSGGQQQRVSIARALMNGGHVLLADEPTGALDSYSGAEVMRLFNELAQAGHTILLITHDKQIAQQAERVIEIRDGHIIADSMTGKEAPAIEQQLIPWEPSLDHISSGSRRLESLSAAWRAICAHRLRSFLTLLGIVIGVASIIVMLAVGEGARQRVMVQMGTMGTSILYMSSIVPATGGPKGELTAEDLQAVAQLASISQVMPVIGDPIMVRYGNVSRSIYVFAANESMPLIHHWPMAKGRFYSAAEDHALVPVVVLGASVSRRFFGDDSPLGQQLLIGQGSFEVIGVMQERGADSGAQDYDDMVFIPYESARARVYRTQTQPDYVVLEASGTEQVYEAEAQLRQLLIERHGGREDFGIGNAAARLQAEAATRRSMSMMLGMIAAVSLLVGGIGVMNVMLMSVKERTREIGIRMAIGARQADIRSLFISESALLSIGGGLSGVGLGILSGAIMLYSGIPMVFSIRAICVAFLTAVLVGILFAYMPARAAARLDPVRALTGE